MLLRWYLLRELLAAVGLAAGTLTVILFLMNFLGPMREYGFVSLGFLAASTPPVLAYLLPMTLLSGVVVGLTLGYGRLAGDNEIDAMRVSGVPLRWILVPAAMIGAAAALAAILLHWDVLPEASLRRHQLRNAALREMLRSPRPGPEQFWLGSGIRMSYRRAETGVFRDFRIFIYAGQRVSDVHSAREARLLPGDDAVVEMLGYRRLRFDDKGERHVEQSAESGSFRLPIADSDSGGAHRPKYASMARLLEIMRRPETRNEAMTEFHTRIASSVAPMGLAVLAALIGIRARRSSRLAGLGASLPPLILYLLLALPLERLAVAGFVDPLLAAYAPIAIIAAADGLLYRRMEG